MRQFNYMVLPEKKQVIATATYRGKRMRAVATAQKNDEFDPHEGIRVAGLKLDMKLTEKQIKNAERRMSALDAEMEALDQRRNMLDAKYWNTSSYLEMLSDHLEETQHEYEELCDEDPEDW